MPSNRQFARLPTEQTMAEPHELLDRLTDWVQRHDDQATREWVVQTVAGICGVQIFILPNDATDRADLLGDAWVTAVLEAGRDREERAGVSIVAIGKTKELWAVLDQWRDQGDQTDAMAILESGWGSPTMPPRSGR